MNQPTYHTPPRLPSYILGWLLKDHQETPLGDFEEYYNALAASDGVRSAQLWYWGQVIRLLPDQLYEKLYWGIAMLKNYFLLGFRSLRKNKLASSINIVGLSAAIGCAITIFLLIQEVTIDDFHENGDRAFLVEHTIERDSRQEDWGTSPIPLAPALANDFPQIEHAVRLAEEVATIRASTYAFQERVSFADPGFLDVLTFPLIKGQKMALNDPGAVIISSKMAEKYFRNQDPIGQPLEFKFSNQVVEVLTVQAVAKSFPDRASLTFDFLIGYDKRFAAGLANEDDWSAFTAGTFILLQESADPSLIEAQLANYVPVQNAANESLQVQSFFLENIQHPNLLQAYNVHDRVMSAFPIWEMAGFAFIGLLVLLISCFNYITISLGSASSRLKEIGIRKTSGAERGQLITQFLTENLLLCYLALLGGIFIAWAFILPFWENVTSMRLTLDFFNNLGLWFFLGGLFAFIGLISGSYPAFYVSSFEPSAILRGKLKLGEQKRLTRVLTTVQFTLTIITICLSLFMVSLDNTLTGGDWGYDQTQSVVIPDLSPEQYARLHEEALRLAGIQQVAGAEHHIGASLSATLIQVNGEEQEAAFYGIGPEYLDVMGINVVSGRAFANDVSAGNTTGVMVNQSMVQAQGWQDPIGQQIRIDEVSFAVIGVVEDFLLHPLAGKAHPVILRLSDSDTYSYLALHVDNGTEEKVTASLQSIWDEQFPGMDFFYFRQQEVFQEFDFIIELTHQLSRYLGLFALFVSCMGLFGIASQRVGQRMKEVGIRKAMGASAFHVIFLVNRGFLTMLGIATLIATPLCYFALGALLQQAPADIPLSLTPFIVSNLLVLGVAAASLSTQTNKLLKVKPAEVLRYA